MNEPKAYIIRALVEFAVLNKDDKDIQQTILHLLECTILPPTTKGH